MRRKRGMKAIHAKSEILKGGKESNKSKAENRAPMKDILLFFNFLIGLSLHNYMM